MQILKILPVFFNNKIEAGVATNIRLRIWLSEKLFPKKMFRGKRNCDVSCATIIAPPPFLSLKSHRRAGFDSYPPPVVLATGIRYLVYEHEAVGPARVPGEPPRGDILHLVVLHLINKTTLFQIFN